MKKGNIEHPTPNIEHRKWGKGNGHKPRPKRRGEEAQKAQKGKTEG
jgi:hypothetical protein